MFFFKSIFIFLHSCSTVLPRWSLVFCKHRFFLKLIRFSRVGRPFFTSRAVRKGEIQYMLFFRNLIARVSRPFFYYTRSKNGKHRKLQCSIFFAVFPRSQAHFLKRWVPLSKTMRGNRLSEIWFGHYNVLQEDLQAEVYICLWYAEQDQPRLCRPSATRQDMMTWKFCSWINDKHHLKLRYIYGVQHAAGTSKSMSLRAKSRF